ncbi:MULTISPECIES: DUF6233 domain-containing protein [unclassified Streptomyces]|uniref:DUF6233 domain-containing protein n=1 Tax=Streptomyces sp. NBC_00119 TaxID=2975659 RepID=A0AAU1TZN0_9ACTN|nr:MULTISPECIES: DUF6233 domain-containing protein [unclassified Streptomyces]MCX4648135.1 DUF6233 domain-containing protein [Streptomyces sp. NBC_01446]MCX5323744.1 DUF6233 domain-containing protein [Streptomyces sp. NBC_00120]
MNDSGAPTRLDLLRFLERVQVGDLDRTRRWIAAEERRETERQRGAQVQPPTLDWLIEMGLDGRDPVYVHVGGCHMAGKRSRGVDRDQAIRAVTEGVDACPHCRPDTELGLLD